MAKVEILNDDDSGDESAKGNNEQDKISKEREKRRLERIRKQSKSIYNRPENKKQLSDHEIVANELESMYKTDKQKWLQSYRGSYLSIDLKQILIFLIAAPIVLGLFLLPFRDFRLYMITGVSLISWYVTVKLVPELKGYMLKCEIIGKDLNKTGSRDSKPPIPEAMGIIPAIIFLVGAIVIIGILDFSKDKILLFMSGLLCITFMILLGFVDDVVELKWKYKLILPFVASIALLIVYDGITSIVVPLPLRFIFGKILELGIFYKVYFVCLTIFCTNSINIHAGINGLEIGQTLVIASFTILHNIIEIYRKETEEIYENHMFSFAIMMPFMFTSLGLFKFSKFPSKIFVGDTYTTFAGIVFAVCAILGHFSKTLMLFFVPQLINFLMSLPQILGFIYCPRHRMPSFDKESYKLNYVPNHFTLINATLRLCGPMNEEQ